MCVEAGEERRGPGRGWEKPCGGWIERDGSCLVFLFFFGLPGVYISRRAVSELAERGVRRGACAGQYACTP